MKFAGEPTPVPGLGQEFCHQHFVWWDRLAVLAGAGSPRITTGQETGPAGCTDRALPKTVLKKNTALGQPVNIWRFYVRISVHSQCIQALLVGANPQNIRSFHSFYIFPKTNSKFSLARARNNFVKRILNP